MMPLRYLIAAEYDDLRYLIAAVYDALRYLISSLRCAGEGKRSLLFCTAILSLDIGSKTRNIQTPKMWIRIVARYKSAEKHARGGVV